MLFPIPYQGASGDPGFGARLSDSYDIDHPVSMEDHLVIMKISVDNPMDVGTF